MNSVERVKMICKDRKIAISKLEKDLGYANGYIGQLRKGVFPDIRLAEIAAYLSVSTTFLLTGTEKTTPGISVRRSETQDINLTDEEADMIRKYRRLDERGRSAVLNTLEHELSSLPGDKAAPAPKQA